MKTDVAIIGTGPAGAMAACRLAGTGLRVVILDKCRLPRGKACGGAVPADVFDGLDGDMTGSVEKKIMTVKYLYDHGPPAVIRQHKRPVLILVDRSRFDHLLIRQALSTGGTDFRLEENFKVTGIAEDENGVAVYGKGREKIAADFVVAADGAGSQAAKSLGLTRYASSGMAINARVVVSPEVYGTVAETATFNFFCLPGGYGWIFPKDGYLSCGVGTMASQKIPGKAMDDFLAKSFPKGSIHSVKRVAHPLPIYTGHKPIATRRVCLAGDAARLVDPITGEGIRHALKSGAMAGDVIAGLMGATSKTPHEPFSGPLDHQTCQAYQDRVHRDMGQDLAILYRLALPVFREAPDFFYDQFILKGRSYVRCYRGLAERMGGFSAPSPVPPQ